MNKETITSILQACLFSLDEVCFIELVNDKGFTPEIAEAGIKLCDYLKSINPETTLTTQTTLQENEKK